MALRQEPPDLHVEIGRRIQKRREQLGFSQEYVGKALVPPITRSAISNIERGRQNLYVHTLYALARVLNSKLETFLPRQTEDPLRSMIEQQLQRQNLPQESKEKIWETLRSEKQVKGANPI